MIEKQNIYNINAVWRGLYGSKHRLKERAKLLNIVIDEDTLLHDDFERLLRDRIESNRASDDVKRVATAILEHFKSGGLSDSPPVPPDNVPKPPETPDTPPESPPKVIAPPKSGSGFIKTIPEGLIAILGVFPQMFKAAPIVFVFLLLAIGLQVKHIATLVNDVSQNDTFIVGALFGISAECTAIVLTLHNSTSKRVLLIYAGIQFWVNILHYHVFEFEFCTVKNGVDVCVKYWRQVTQITLSGILAFVIYTYSEIFTNLFGEKKGITDLRPGDE